MLYESMVCRRLSLAEAVCELRAEMRASRDCQAAAVVADLGGVFDAAERLPYLPGDIRRADAEAAAALNAVLNSIA